MIVFLLHNQVAGTRCPLRSDACRALPISLVEQFLRGILAGVEQESGTGPWFGSRFPDITSGIFEAFPDTAIRNALQVGRLMMPDDRRNSQRADRPSARTTATNTRASHIQFTCADKLYTCHTDFMNDLVSPSQAERASALAAELRAISGKLKRKLREQGAHSDLRPSQVSVLLRIENDGPATVSSLARTEGMRPQSMSAIITSLLEAGLVSDSPDPNDRRQTLMSLSRKCQKLLKDGRAARQDWLTTTIQKKLSSQEQKKLAAAVNLLARLIED